MEQEQWQGEERRSGTQGAYEGDERRKATAPAVEEPQGDAQVDDMATDQDPEPDPERTQH